MDLSATQCPQTPCSRDSGHTHTANEPLTGSSHSWTLPVGSSTEVEPSQALLWTSGQSRCCSFHRSQDLELGPQGGKTLGRWIQWRGLPGREHAREGGPQGGGTPGRGRPQGRETPGKGDAREGACQGGRTPGRGDLEGLGPDIACSVDPL